MDNRFYFGFNTAEERNKRRKAELYSMSEQVSTFFWDEAPQHGLEMREGQQDMSFEIVDALINDQHFAIEAGVGIGKSFGYLVPVLLYSKRMNKPVIIATSTIALQEQLWRDVHAVMPLLGLNRDVILAKGQTHYLCNKRADEYMCDPKADPPDALKEGIKQGYEERKDFPEVLPQGVWDKVTVQRFSMKNCGSCEKKCKYYKVRAALKFTDGVVLCNQDFLTQHLMKLRRGQDGLINAAADLLVVDEAHNLDDKVRSATTERFGQGMLFGMIKSAFYELRSSDQSSVSGEKREAESAIIAFYNCLKAQVQKQINEAEQDLFSSPARADESEKWVDFVAEFWHCGCICERSEKAFVSKYQKWCKKHGYNFGAEKACAIYAEASGHIGVMPKSETTKLLVEQAVSQLRATSAALAALKHEMQSLASMLPEYPVVMDMFGVGPTLGPQLIAEIGDVRRFSSKKALVAYAGLDAPPNDSGDVTGRHKSMSKVGASSLRRTLFLIMSVYLQNAPLDEPVYQFMDKKRAEGKPYRVYMMASANKFLRIYYATVKAYLESLEHTA